MKVGVRNTGQGCEESNACIECFACLHEPLITWTWFSRQISPWGWLNTIAFPSSKSQVCVAKHTTRQWKLAVWMMVITLTTEAANASFQEGAVWWASLMSVQEQEFIYLLLVWLNCSAGEASGSVSVYLTMHYTYMYDQSNQFYYRDGPPFSCFSFFFSGLEMQNTSSVSGLDVLKHLRWGRGIKHECILHWGDFYIRFACLFFLFFPPLFWRTLNWCWECNKAEHFFFSFLGTPAYVQWIWQMCDRWEKSWLLAVKIWAAFPSLRFSRMFNCSQQIPHHLSSLIKPITIGGEKGIAQPGKIHVEIRCCIS